MVCVRTYIWKHALITRREWAGYICRMDLSGTPRNILKGNMYVSQPVGKPRDRRSDPRYQKTTRDARMQNIKITFENLWNKK
jgi:hypothetical protein